jgi:NAD-dependent SIR2 family protein deacetylase
MSFASLSQERASLLEFLTANAPLLVLTGAGISSGCGIPTYRDESGRWLRSEPITHQEFIGTPRQRQRYWGRSAIGWPAVRDALPSRAHGALGALQRQGLVGDIVTQNVDRLHQKAGSHAVIDLHGRLDRVLCLDCGEEASRDALQQELLTLNPWLDRATGEARPDGDASLQEHEVDRVNVPACARCGGVLMPDVVFFGGSIPRQRIESCKGALRRARGLLVVGSSLQVYSGYRFCRWAAADGKPIALLNPGKSRADALATLKLSGRADELLPQLQGVYGDTPIANCLEAGG